MAPPLAAQASPPPATSQSDGQGAPRPPQSRVFEIETSAEQLTFGVAVRRALARNPTALQPREEVSRFRALMEEVRSISLPTLSGIGSYTRLDADRVSGGQVAVPKGALNLNVTLSAPLLYPHGWVGSGSV